MCPCVVTKAKNSIKHIYETTNISYVEGRRGHGGWEPHGALRRFLRWGARCGRVIVVEEAAESSAQMSWSYNSSLRRLRRSRAEVGYPTQVGGGFVESELRVRGVAWMSRRFRGGGGTHGEGRRGHKDGLHY
jgi:hypothetical protein